MITQTMWVAGHIAMTTSIARAFTVFENTCYFKSGDCQNDLSGLSGATTFILQGEVKEIKAWLSVENRKVECMKFPIFPTTDLIIFPVYVTIYLCWFRRNTMMNNIFETNVIPYLLF